MTSLYDIDDLVWQFKTLVTWKVCFNVGRDGQYLRSNHILHHYTKIKKYFNLSISLSWCFNNNFCFIKHFKHFFFFNMSYNIIEIFFDFWYLSIIKNCSVSHLKKSKEAFYWYDFYIFRFIFSLCMFGKNNFYIKINNQTFLTFKKNILTV